MEVYQDGYNPRAVRERAGSWARFVATQGDLDDSQRQALDAHGAFIDALDTTDMVKSYKMLVLLAMLNANAFPGSIGIDELADEVERLATRTTKAGADLGAALSDRKALIRLLEQNPIAAWTGGKGTGGVSYFAYEDRTFRTTFNVEPSAVAGLQELVRELAEWRLTEYLDRLQTQTGEFSTLKVSHASGKPILFLPAEPERSDLPNGWTDVQIDGQTYSANFVKVAVNVVRRPDQRTTSCRRFSAAGSVPTRALLARGIRLRSSDAATEWHLRPLGRRAGQLQLWRRYSREEIPPLFGLEFSTAIWNVGFVKRPGHIFLLATLDKSGHGAEFQYKDHFISPSEFEWQSQNRTGQRSADGQDIQNHQARNTAVHLFVREQKRRAGGGAAPFVYCGDVSFISWDGEKPITVHWKLPEEVPERLREVLGVPRPEGA